MTRNPNPLELLTAYQGSAVVAAACSTGVADAIAGGPRQPGGVAAACGTHPRATQGLLGALAALASGHPRDDRGAGADCARPAGCRGGYGLIGWTRRRHRQAHPGYLATTRRGQRQRVLGSFRPDGRSVTLELAFVSPG